MAFLFNRLFASRAQFRKCLADNAAVPQYETYDRIKSATDSKFTVSVESYDENTELRVTKNGIRTTTGNAGTKIQQSSSSLNQLESENSESKVQKWLQGVQVRAQAPHKRQLFNEEIVESKNDLTTPEATKSVGQKVQLKEDDDQSIEGEVQSPKNGSQRQIQCNALKTPDDQATKSLAQLPKRKIQQKGQQLNKDGTIKTDSRKILTFSQGQMSSNNIGMRDLSDEAERTSCENKRRKLNGVASTSVQISNAKQKESSMKSIDKSMGSDKEIESTATHSSFKTGTFMIADKNPSLNTATFSENYDSEFTCENTASLSKAEFLSSSRAAGITPSLNNASKQCMPSTSARGMRDLSVEAERTSCENKRRKLNGVASTSVQISNAKQKESSMKSIDKSMGSDKEIESTATHSSFKTGTFMIADKNPSLNTATFSENYDSEFTCENTASLSKAEFLSSSRAAGITPSLNNAFKQCMPSTSARGMRDLSVEAERTSCENKRRKLNGVASTSVQISNAKQKESSMKSIDKSMGSDKEIESTATHSSFKTGTFMIADKNPSLNTATFSENYDSEFTCENTASLSKAEFLSSSRAAGITPSLNNAFKQCMPSTSARGDLQIGLLPRFTLPDSGSPHNLSNSVMQSETINSKNVPEPLEMTSVQDKPSSQQGTSKCDAEVFFNGNRITFSNEIDDFTNIECEISVIHTAAVSSDNDIAGEPSAGIEFNAVSGSSRQRSEIASNDNSVEAEEILPKKRKSRSRSIGSQDNPTRKRKRNVSLWKSNVRKTLKNLGQEYVSSNGKVVEAVKMREPCACSKNCVHRLPKDQREKAFEKFWALGDHERQWEFIRNHSRSKPTLNGAKRKQARSYFFKIEKIEVLVCKNMFMSTLSIWDSWIDSAYKHINEEKGVSTPSKQGKHKKHFKVISPAMVDNVKVHVGLFPRTHSHYCRKTSRREYLENGLSLHKMAKLYLQWAKVNVAKKKDVASIRNYIDIVNENFNLGFFKPKKDQCHLCCIMKNKHNTRQVRQDRLAYWAQHIKNKKRSRELRDKDVKEGVKDKTIAVCSFDMQKQLPCPKSECCAFFYKLKLNVFNFTVFQMVERVGMCYLWHEGLARKGADEVSSSVYQYINGLVAKGYKDIRFYSDNCGNQNKNRFLFAMYLFAAVRHQIKITHRYFEPGHTQMEVDSIHARIENATKKKEIFDFEEWTNEIEQAKEELPPYSVTKLNRSNVLSFRELVSKQNWEVDLSGEKVAWKKVKEVQANGIEGSIFRLRYEYDGRIVSVSPNRVGRPVNLKTYSPPFAYTGTIPLKESTIKDLQYLMKNMAIPENKHPFFLAVLAGVDPVQDEEDEYEYDTEEELCLNDEDDDDVEETNVNTGAEEEEIEEESEGEEDESDEDEESEDN